MGCTTRCPGDAAGAPGLPKPRKRPRALKKLSDSYKQSKTCLVSDMDISCPWMAALGGDQGSPSALPAPPRACRCRLPRLPLHQQEEGEGPGVDINLPWLPTLVLPRSDGARHLPGCRLALPLQKEVGTLVGVRLRKGRCCRGCWRPGEGGDLSGQVNNTPVFSGGQLPCKGQVPRPPSPLCAQQWEAWLLPCAASPTLGGFVEELPKFVCHERVMPCSCTPRH